MRRIPRLSILVSLLWIAISQGYLLQLHRGGSTFHRSVSHVQLTKSADEENLRSEAAKLMAKAQALRQDILRDESRTNTILSDRVETKPTLPWSLANHHPDDTVGASSSYRLYVDIGREEGTWMDPRWGASGKRIEFTLDVRFLSTDCTNTTFLNAMVQDNLSGKSSTVRNFQSAPMARLRNGFDRMRCQGGAYRLDVAEKGSNTVRFHLCTDGIADDDPNSSYGDIYIPSGFLYFSLPVFGSNLSHVSTKTGIVSVRQWGWHTGWRRLESRMVGTFRAVPLEQAQQRDGF